MHLEREGVLLPGDQVMSPSSIPGGVRALAQALLFVGAAGGYGCVIVSTV